MEPTRAKAKALVQRSTIPSSDDEMPRFEHS
jgi:hypothetical protein